MASTTTDYSEIQQNEIEALRSIFMEDFVEEEIKTGAWNVRYNMSEVWRTFCVIIEA